MADKDDFSFDKDAPQTPPPSAEPLAGKKAQPAPSRALLLGLLLVVLGAAAYFYAMEMMAPEEVAVPAAVTKQLITPPPPPAPAEDAAASAKQEPATADKPAEPATGAAAAPAASATPAAESAPVVQELPKLADKGVLKEVPIEPPQVATEAVGPAAQAVAEGSAGSPTTTVDPPSATSGPEPGPKVSAAGSQPSRGAFTLLAGAYISPEVLKSATSKVKKLGYQPRTLRDAKLVEMTRVRIGAYTPDEARSKLAEVKKIAPDAFTLPEGDQVAVYAASHFDPAAHRAFAESLRKAGVVFEEEKVMRKMPMTELFFGDFPDRDAAEKAAEKARKAGLEIIVFKRP